MKIGELVNESNFNIWKSFANEYSNFVNSNFRHFYHLILSVFKFVKMRILFIMSFKK